MAYGLTIWPDDAAIRLGGPFIVGEVRDAYPILRSRNRTSATRNDQEVDPTAGSRKAPTCDPTDLAEQPQFS
jgi:hypothetical protein